MGKEGRQAVRCSDFALAKFYCLQRAFLVHGQWYYLRLATVVQYFFYKNLVFNTPQVCDHIRFVIFHFIFTLLNNFL